MNWMRIEDGTIDRLPAVLRPPLGVYDIKHSPSTDGRPEAPALYLVQLLDTLRRRRRRILTIAICGTVLATMAALLVSPKYTASAQLIVETAQKAGPPSAPSDAIAIDTQVKMLTSPDHLQRVVDELLADPDFVAVTQRSGTEAATEHSDEPVKPPPMATETSGIAELNRRLHIWIRTLYRSRHGAPLDIEDLERRLKVAQDGRSRIITVRYTSRNPDEASIVANKAVQMYVDGQNAQASKYTSFELARLRAQISDARSNIDKTTSAVQKAAQEWNMAARTSDGDQAREASDRLRGLERQAAASGLAYSKLQNREKELLGQRDGSELEVRILSLATPPDEPSSHNPIIFILPALIIFLIGGSFVAVIAEQNDRALRSQRDVSDALDIPCIGLVPRLPSVRNLRPHQYMLTEPFAPYTKAIRAVVGELWLTTPRFKPTTVLVTSSVPGEGKTTSAISIAVCAATLGRRVLLIDLDFKRPSVARELGRSAETGLFDILLHKQSPADVTTHIPDLGIDYIAMPAFPIDVLPILASEKIPLLLRQLSEKYDSIIIDAPPLLVTTETRLLAPMVNKVLLVVKWGSTRREVVQNAMSLLHSPNCVLEKHADTPAVLLTQVNLKEHASYRYGDFSEALVKYDNYYSRSVDS
jgi:succinoglycan biosynthesis transport protein ExoP